MVTRCLDAERPRKPVGFGLWRKCVVILWSASGQDCSLKTDQRVREVAFPVRVQVRRGLVGEHN